MPFINRCGAIIGETGTSSNITIHTGTIQNPDLSYGIDLNTPIGANDEFFIFGTDQDSSMRTYCNFKNGEYYCHFYDGYCLTYSFSFSESIIYIPNEAYYQFSGNYKWVLIHYE